MSRPICALRDEDGGIDLPSTMVSILVIAAFLAAAALAVFVVIPWAQDNAAKRLVEQVSTAQSAYYPMSAEHDPGHDPHYGTKDQLAAAGVLSAQAAADEKVSVQPANTTAADLEGPHGPEEDYFTVAVRSATGAEFIATSQDPQPFRNLIANSSFEDGLEGWQASDGHPLPITGYTWSTQFGQNGARFLPGSHAIKATVPTAVQPGQVWEFSFQYKRTHGAAKGAPRAALRLTEYGTGASHADNGSRGMGLDFTPTPDWQRASHRFTTDPGATAIRPRILGLDVEDGVVAVDNAVLRRVR